MALEVAASRTPQSGTTTVVGPVQAPTPQASVDQLAPADIDRSLEQRQIQSQSQTQSTDAAFASTSSAVAQQVQELSYQRARALYNGNQSEADTLAQQTQSLVSQTNSSLSQPQQVQLQEQVQAATNAGTERWTNALRDASQLSVAMTGADDEQKIHQILEQNKTPEQMAALKEAYAARYGTQLETDLSANLGGTDIELARALISQDPVAIGAAKLLWATRGAGTDEAMIKDVYRNASPEMIQQIEARFNSQYSSWSSGWMMTSMGSIDSVLKAELNTNDYNEIKAHREKTTFAAQGLSPEAVDAAARIEKALSGTFNDDEAGALNALRTMTAEQRGQVAAAYSSLYPGTSLEERLAGELSFSQMQEARMYLANDPQAHVLALDRAIKDQDYELTKELLSAQQLDGLTQADLRSRLQTLSGLDAEKYIAQNFNSRDSDALASLLKDGRVDDISELRRAIVGYTSSAEENTVLSILQGKSKEQIAELSRQYAERYPGSDLQQDVIANLGGREEFLGIMAMRGEPTTVADLQTNLRDQMAYESSGWWPNSGSEYRALTRDMERFEASVSGIENPSQTLLTSLSPDQALTVNLCRKAVEIDFNSYSGQRNVLAEQITTGAVIVACTAVTIATAGAGAPIWGIALAAGASSFATKYLVKSALQGRSYDSEEIAIDLATSTVEGASAFIGGTAGARALQTTARAIATRAAARAGAEVTEEAIKAAEKVLIAQIANGTADAATSATTNAFGTGMIQGDVWEDGVRAGLQRLAIVAGSEFVTSGAMSNSFSSVSSLASRVRGVADNVNVGGVADDVAQAATTTRTDVASSATTEAATTTTSEVAAPALTGAPDTNAHVDTNIPANTVADATSSAPAAATSTNPQVETSVSSGAATEVTTRTVETTAEVIPGTIKPITIRNSAGMAEGPAIDATSLGLSSAEPRINVITRGLELIGGGDPNIRQQLNDLGIAQSELDRVTRRMLLGADLERTPNQATRNLLNQLEKLEERIARIPEGNTAAREASERKLNFYRGIFELESEVFTSTNGGPTSRMARSMIGVAQDGTINARTLEGYVELRSVVSRLSDNPNMSGYAQRVEQFLASCEEQLVNSGTVAPEFRQRLALQQLSGKNNVLQLPENYLVDSTTPIFAGRASDSANLEQLVESAWIKTQRALLVSDGGPEAQRTLMRQQERIRLVADDLEINTLHLTSSRPEVTTKTFFERIIVPEGADKADYHRRAALLVLLENDIDAQARARTLGILKPEFTPHGNTVHVDSLADNIDLSRPEVQRFIEDNLIPRYQDFIAKESQRMLAGGSPTPTAVRSWQQFSEVLGTSLPSTELREGLIRSNVATALVDQLRAGGDPAQISRLVREYGCQDTIARRVALDVVSDPTIAAARVRELEALNISPNRFVREVKSELDRLGRRGAEVEVAQRERWFTDETLANEAQRIENQIAAYDEAMMRSGLPYNRYGAFGQYEQAYDAHFAILPEPYLINRLYDRLGNSFSSVAATITATGSNTLSGISVQLSNAGNELLRRMNEGRRLASAAFRPRSTEPVVAPEVG